METCWIFFSFYTLSVSTWRRALDVSQICFENDEMGLFFKKNDECKPLNDGYAGWSILECDVDDLMLPYRVWTMLLWQHIMLYGCFLNIYKKEMHILYDQNQPFQRFLYWNGYIIISMPISISMFLDIWQQTYFSL